MRRLEIPVGTRFGRLTVVGEAEPTRKPSGQVSRRIDCVCECGGALFARLADLCSGNTASCGCLNLELRASRATTHGQTIGRAPSLMYRLWASIKQRSVAGSAGNSEQYIGRGIGMYPPWAYDFVSFSHWVIENLGERPKGFSLDRIDNEAGYVPGNLRWASSREQNNNKRNNTKVRFGGRTLTIHQCEQRFGIGHKLIRQRIFRDGWSVEKALTTPVRKSRHAN